MSEWKEYKLGDLNCKFLSGYAFKSSDYKIDGIPLVKIGNIQNGIVRTTNSVNCVSSDLINSKTEKFLLKNRDVLIAMTGQGSVGRIGKLYLNDGEMAFLNQRVGKFICDEKNINIGYLYYVLTTPEFQKILFDSASGSGQPNLSPEIILNTKIPYVNFETQTAIAEILSSLDDKIELNNKINQELETLAQTLFKQWFIDFEFPNENGEPYKSSGGEMVDSELGEIPKGWKVDSLDNIAEFLNGLALQKFPPESDYEFLPVIKIRELRQKDTSNSDKASVNIPEKYIIKDGDVLFSWSGSLMIDFWTNGKGALNQHLFKVTSKEYPKWYYYLWTKHHLMEFIEIAESKATTMGHIQRQHLTNAKVVIPTENTILNFTLVFEPIISKIIDNRIECGELINLRDTLLPKLISGELSINESKN